LPHVEAEGVVEAPLSRPGRCRYRNRRSNQIAVVHR
jgi:hypothetical protein